MKAECPRHILMKKNNAEAFIQQVNRYWLNVMMLVMRFTRSLPLTTIIQSRMRSMCPTVAMNSLDDIASPCHTPLYLGFFCFINVYSFILLKELIAVNFLANIQGFYSQEQGIVSFF